MRIRGSLVVAAMLLCGSAAWAQQPINPYGTADVAGPATDPAQPINPYSAPYGQGYGNYPPPPPRVASPPAYQQGYYLYPARQPTYYYYTPRHQYRLRCPNPCAVQPIARVAPRPFERIRRFSLGVHGTVMGVNQRVGKDDVVLGGAGIQFRIRSKGRFGLELHQSFLGTSYWDGDWERRSFPFAFSLMVYVFPNQDTRHFNLYGLAGFGAMFDSVRLRNPEGRMVKQEFLEWMGHVGAGLELRWKWFALAGDVRLIGTILDKTSKPAKYYANVQGGPIPDKGYAVQGNLYLNFWF